MMHTYMDVIAVTKESEVVGHLLGFVIFCAVKFLPRIFSIFASDESISTQKKANNGSRKNFSLAKFCKLIVCQEFAAKGCELLHGSGVLAVFCIVVPQATPT